MRWAPFQIEPYIGENPLYRHGPFRVSQDKKYFQHIDGTPFFWLGDTWWMSLTKRLAWPEDFKTLTADRAAPPGKAMRYAARRRNGIQGFLLQVLRGGADPVR